MRITPLHRWRTTSDGTITPWYGNQSYLTHGYHFSINYSESVWRIKPNIATKQMWEEAIATGVLDASFPRRRDAVAALQLIMGEVDG